MITRSNSKGNSGWVKRTVPISPKDMKNIKKSLFFLIAVTMCLAFTIPAFASLNDSIVENTTFTVSSAVYNGENLTVTLNISEVTMDGLCHFFFHFTKDGAIIESLESVSISPAGFLYVPDDDSHWIEVQGPVEATTASPVVTAIYKVTLNDGTYQIGVTGPTEEDETFWALDETISEELITVSPQIVPLSLTITDGTGQATAGSGSSTPTEVPTDSITNSTGGAATVTSSIADGTATLNVASEKACVVAYTTDGGQTYTRLTATAATSGYDFSVPNYSDTMKFVVAVKGDLNGDGDTDGTDAYQIDRYDAGLRTLTALQALVCDINGDGDTDGTDSYQIERLDAGLRTFNWDI